MGKTQAGLGTGLSSLPVRFNSNTLEKAASSRREGHVFSYSCGVLAEHRRRSVADRLAPAEIDADDRSREGGFRRLGGVIRYAAILRATAGSLLGWLAGRGGLRLQSPGRREDAV